MFYVRLSVFFQCFPTSHGRPLGQAIIFCSCGFCLLLLSFFFLAYSRRSQILCGLSANLECRSDICCTRLVGNAGCKKSPKMRHYSAHRLTNSLGYIFAIKACIDNRRKLLNSNISSTYVNNMVNFGSLTAEIG